MQELLAARTTGRRGARAFGPRVGVGSALGAAAVLGWSLHDLGVVATSGDPRAALQLVPAHLLACILGGSVGAALAASRWSAASVLLLALAAAGARRLGLALPERAHDVARAALLLVGVTGGALLLAERLRGRALVLAGALGLLACAGLTRLRGDPRQMLLPLVLAAVAALPVLLVRPRLPRRLALAALAVAALVPLFRISSHRFPLPRPDLPSPPAPAHPSPNLLVVIMDTVRADHLSSYGYARETTPHIDAWAHAHAVRYTNARSPSSWTLPAHASLFTGLLPGEHGATHVRALPDDATPQNVAHALRTDVPTLAETLREAGYRTAGIFANHVFLGRDYGIGRGFEHHDARRGNWIGDYRTLVQRAGFALEPGHVPYQDAKSVSDRALAWLGEQHDRQPFFLALNYMDAHAPLLPPAPYDRMFDARRPRDPLQPENEILPLLYDREIAWMDSQIGRVLDTLDEYGIADDTVVVICADHGEAFGEHGFWKHDWTLYESVVHVPLFIRSLGERAAPESDEEVSLRDVFGMVLDDLGLGGGPPAGWFGEWYRMAGADNLDEPFLKEKDVDRDLVSWIEDGRKLIVSSDGTVEAWSLDEEDHEHAVSLSAAEMDAARARARSWWSSHPPPSSGEAAPVDAEQERQMQALGYAGGRGH